MMLPQLDIDFLTQRGLDFKVAGEGNMTCVVITRYRLPAGYDRTEF